MLFEKVCFQCRIGVSISNSELGIVLLSAVQKMGYDCATDDQKKAPKAFVVGKDPFQQAAVNLSATPASSLALAS